MYEICVFEIPTTAVTCTTNKSTSDQCMDATADFVESLKYPLAIAVESLHDPCNLIRKGSLSSCAGNPFKRNDGMQVDAFVALRKSNKSTSDRCLIAAADLVEGLKNSMATVASLFRY